MTIRKRSKQSRGRGSNTFFTGGMKKNRGAGNRGGRGNAGSGKKGDSKNQRYQKIKKYFGSYGFNSHSRTITKTINLSDLNKLVHNLILTKAIKDEKIIKLDLAKQGYTKLLGKGKAKRAYEIKIPLATEKAVERIEAMKGSVKTKEPVLEESSSKPKPETKEVAE